MRSALFAGTVAVVVAGASFPLQALAQGSIEERRACTSDAVRLCREFIPDPGKIAACLTARKAELSDQRSGLRRKRLLTNAARACDT